MSAANDIRRFARSCERNLEAAYRGSKLAALNSIRYGSDITGSPGQPVRAGTLRDSWEIEDEDVFRAMIFTTSPYALSNEDGIARPGGGPYVLRSAVGGRWSVLKTRRNFDRLVEDVVTKLLSGQRRAR